jgi:hypothetical protein
MQNHPGQRKNFRAKQKSEVRLPQSQIQEMKGVRICFQSQWIQLFEQILKYLQSKYIQIMKEKDKREHYKPNQGDIE